MFSRVSICKVCIRRVLDDQLYPHNPQQCIYCLKEHLEKEVELMERKREDYFFALQIMDHNHTELSAAYEAAIFEIDKLRNELEGLRSHFNFKCGLDELVD